MGLTPFIAVRRPEETLSKVLTQCLCKLLAFQIHHIPWNLASNTSFSSNRFIIQEAIRISQSSNRGSRGSVQSVDSLFVNVSEIIAMFHVTR